MNATRKIVLGGLLLALVGSAQPGRAQTRPGMATFLEPSEGSLLTPDTLVRARRSAEFPEVRAVEFRFTPAGRAPIVLGNATDTPRQGYGPDCGRIPCAITDEFWAELGSLRGVPEGPGTLAVRLPGASEDEDIRRVYWDATPPKAEFVSPRFREDSLPAYVIVLRSPDENLTSVKVTFRLVLEGNRNVPLFEQHLLGPLLTDGGHASCVPTAVAANLRWVDATNQADVVPSISDFSLVTGLGGYMGTMGGGTSGAGAVNGTENWLEDQGYDNFPPWFPEVQIDHTYNPNGISIPTLAYYFQAGYAVNLGIHNLAGDSGFGHFVALDNIIPQANGSALIRVMDPNVEPPGSPTGAYRIFVMQPDSTIAWSNAAIGYGNPQSGKMKIDEVLAFGEWNDLFNFAQDTGGEGEVQGMLLADGQTWVGVFAPPQGQRGPWLLTAKATDAAGNMQRSWQAVGQAASGM